MSQIPRPLVARSAVALLLFLPLAWLAGAPAEAQDPSAGRQAESPDVAEELARLNRTLTRIADLMERQAEGQRLDLALSRVAMESERVTEIERQLRNAESTQSSLENERFQLQSRFAMMAVELEEVPPDVSEEELRQAERMAAEAQRMMERIESQIQSYERRTLELQNELTRRRADLQALQDRLDRQLDGM